MGVDTTERAPDSTHPTNSSASRRNFWEADGRDPIVMQAIETVTDGRAGTKNWAYDSKEITQAIYDEIRRLDRERVEAVASLSRKYEQFQLEVVTG
jgi:hypothetical protein